LVASLLQKPVIDPVNLEAKDSLGFPNAKRVEKLMSQDRKSDDDDCMGLPANEVQEGQGSKTDSAEREEKDFDSEVEACEPVYPENKQPPSPKSPGETAEEPATNSEI
jgi:hypothetical protein